MKKTLALFIQIWCYETLFTIIISPLSVWCVAPLVGYCMYECVFVCVWLHSIPGEMYLLCMCVCVCEWVCMCVCVHACVCAFRSQHGRSSFAPTLERHQKILCVCWRLMLSVFLCDQRLPCSKTLTNVTLSRQRCNGLGRQSNSQRSRNIKHRHKSAFLGSYLSYEGIVTTRDVNGHFGVGADGKRDRVMCVSRVCVSRCTY